MAKKKGKKQPAKKPAAKKTAAKKAAPPKRSTFWRITDAYRDYNATLPESRQISEKRIRRAASDLFQAKYKGVPDYRVRVGAIKQDVAAAYEGPQINWYGLILATFGELNPTYPERQQLPYRERQRHASELYQDRYKPVPEGQRSPYTVEPDVRAIYDSLAPQVDADVTLLPYSFIAYPIDWYAIDPHIVHVLPSGIFIRVNAGEFGRTEIFNTRSYNYEKDGVKDIYEEIRPYCKSDAFWSGYRDLMEGRENDGDPDSYFIDFILHLNGVPVVGVPRIKLTTDPTEATQKKKEEVRKIINERKEVVEGEKRAKQAFRKKLPGYYDKLKKIGADIKRSKRPATVAKNQAAYRALFAKITAYIQDGVNRGFLNESQLKKELERLTNMRLPGDK